MSVRSLWLTGFRCFDTEVIEPDPRGLTVLRGPNGAGKTSVLEALSWLATGRSWRTSSRDALVRAGTARAVVRAELADPARRLSVEADIPREGPAKVRVNGQVVSRRAEVADALRVVLFSPDDLALVSGGPAGRREMVDDVLATRHTRWEALQRDVDRILRQRGALLHQSGGRIDATAAATLDVWDARLASAGTALADAREALVALLDPLVAAAHRRIAGVGPGVRLAYQRSWEGDLGDALAKSRVEDVRRRATGVGPHRDDMLVWLADRPARTHASQGEQRSVALALRLGAYHLILGDGGAPPVLLLDDVFSELDPARASALVAELPLGQVLLTTAVEPPPGVSPDRVLDVSEGRIAAGAS